MRKIKLEPPPGIDIGVRCIDCKEAIPIAELLTLQALRDLVEHILTFNHEIVVLARRKT